MSPEQVMGFPNGDEDLRPGELPGSPGPRIREVHSHASQWLDFDRQRQDDVRALLTGRAGLSTMSGLNGTSGVATYGGGGISKDSQTVTVAIGSNASAVLSERGEILMGGGATTDSTGPAMTIGIGIVDAAPNTFADTTVQTGLGVVDAIDKALSDQTLTLLEIESTHRTIDKSWSCLDLTRKVSEMFPDSQEPALIAAVYGLTKEGEQMQVDDEQQQRQTARLIRDGSIHDGLGFAHEYGDPLSLEERVGRLESLMLRMPRRDAGTPETVVADVHRPAVDLSKVLVGIPTPITDRSPAPTPGAEPVQIREEVSAEQLAEIDAAVVPAAQVPAEPTPTLDAYFDQGDQTFRIMANFKQVVNAAHNLQGNNDLWAEERFVHLKSLIVTFYNHYKVTLDVVGTYYLINYLLSQQTGAMDRSIGAYTAGNFDAQAGTEVFINNLLLHYLRTETPSHNGIPSSTNFHAFNLMQQAWEENNRLQADLDNIRNRVAAASSVINEGLASTIQAVAVR